MRALTEHQKSEIVRLRGEQYSQSEIAKAIGVHKQTVSDFLRSKGLGGRADKGKDGGQNGKVGAPSMVETVPDRLPREPFHPFPPEEHTLIGRIEQAIRLLRTIADDLDKLPRIR